MGRIIVNNYFILNCEHLNEDIIIFNDIIKNDLILLNRDEIMGNIDINGYIDRNVVYNNLRPNDNQDLIMGYIDRNVVYNNLRPNDNEDLLGPL